MILSQVMAIVWAQWRSLANHNHRSRGSRIPVATLFALMWYGIWIFISVAIGNITADPRHSALLSRVLPTAFLFVFVYWQVVPIIMVSTGASLDLMRLLVYPIPHAQLFAIEVLLRVTTCIEMLLVSTGFCVGLALNPGVPKWGILAVVVFAFFNLFVSAGLKDLLARLLAKKGFREAIVFLLVLVAALPQLILMGGPPEGSIRWTARIAGSASPWGAAARLSLGEFGVLAAAALIGYTALAWYFGRTQFERTLRFDAAEASARGRAGSRRRQALDIVLQLIARAFPDPLAALIEKEIRSLSRSARFRLLFLMGFSFGLLIWLPMAMRGDSASFIGGNYLTIVSAYALMLLGEICFWNSFGFDRNAVSAYFALPIPIATVFRAKNIAAVFFILLELAMVTLFCALLRMPLTISSVGRAFAVTIVFAAFLLSFGNLLSIRYPRAVDPAQSWRGGSVGRSQAYLLILYPAAAAPVVLAFGAEFAFESSFAFFGVLLLDVLIAAALYTIALESAVETAHKHKEAIVLALSKAESPIGG